jgi:TATA-binding protein-associated factor
MPNFLGSSTSFVRDFAGPIQKGQMTDASVESISESISRLKLLHQKVLPFILRREKEQVLPELPPKTITTIKVVMTTLQAKCYNAYCSKPENRDLLADFDRVLGSNDDDVKNRHMLSTACLKCLLLLRLVCTHPALLHKHVAQNCWDYRCSGKILALAQLLQEAGIYEDKIEAADNDVSLLYCDRVDEEQYDLTSRSDADYSIGKSSKCIIFAQFTKSLDIVEALLFKKLMPLVRYVRLDGRTPPSNRMDIVNTFNRDSNVKVMLSTTRAGGLGTNVRVWLI